MENIFVEK